MQAHTLFVHISQLFQGFFLYPRNVGAGDIQLVGNFTLGKGLQAVKSVSMLYDLLFPLVKTLVYKAVKLTGFYHYVYPVHKIVVLGDYVHKAHTVAILIGVNRFVKIDISCAFFRTSEIHQHFIINALCRIGGKAGGFGIVKGGNSLDKPDGAYGNKLLAVNVRRIVFLHHVGNKAEIMLNKLTSGAVVPLCHSLECLLFLLCGQGLREYGAAVHMQGKVQHMLQKPRDKSAKHKDHLGYTFW